MAKNTVSGGNPVEPIHGFDGATPGEIIQSAVLVQPGTDTPLPSDVTNGLVVTAKQGDRGQQIGSGTVVFPNSDNTERDGPTFSTIPASPQGLGNRLHVWVRNPCDQKLVMRCYHQVFDPNGSTFRWGLVSDLAGEATVIVERTTVVPDGQIFTFEGGVWLVSKVTLKPEVALGGSGGATVSVVASIRG